MFSGEGSSWLVVARGGRIFSICNRREPEVARPAGAKRASAKCSVLLPGTSRQHQVVCGSLESFDVG